MSPSAPAAPPSLDPAADLREAAQSGNVARLRALLADHLDIDARDARGRTALMLAVRRDQKEAVSVLLAAGADPNAADAAGTTPLAAAADAQPEIAAALRRAGAR
jgi:ankyrin repeat protein